MRASGVLEAGYCCHLKGWMEGHEMSRILHGMHLFGH